jgi:hypothetical protein
MRYYFTVLSILLTISCAFSLSISKQKSVTIDGITWQFKDSVSVGRFINGDYYVVGNVTITSVTPKAENGRNGSVLNIPIDDGISGFDDRVSSDRFRENLRVYPPIDLKPGDALVSSISVDTINKKPSWLRPEEKAVSPVKSVSILTCMSEAVPEDAFRPSYADHNHKKIYRKADLHRDLLPKLKKVNNMPDISEYAEHFRRPWLEICFFHFDAPVDYQVQYGREAGRAVGIATLLLMSDYTVAEKEPLLVNFIQYGIDLWGIVEAGYPGWPAHGGHGIGRKWPIIFSGLLLGNDSMASPTVTYPNLRFGEDMQTMYATCWTGAKVVYAGHQGVINNKAVSTTPGWGPYEHKHPSEWTDSNKVGENYRRCCTSNSWVGQTLAARIMNAQKYWDHDAFFDYVDRWMKEDDSAIIATILKERGWDYSGDWQNQGHCWDKYIENMWATYRDLPTPTAPSKKKGTNGGSNARFMGSLKQLQREKQTTFYTIDGRQMQPGRKFPQGLFIIKLNGMRLLRTGLISR